MGEGEKVDVLRARKRSSERTAMALMMRIITRIKLAKSREQVEGIHTVDKLAQPEEKHGWWLEGSSEGTKEVVGQWTEVKRRKPPRPQPLHTNNYKHQWQPVSPPPST